MTGGSPKSHGVFYDDSYDRTLFPPNSNCTGAPGSEALYAENLDYDQGQLDGGGPPTTSSRRNCRCAWSMASAKWFIRTST
jgi:hypothetical protein